MVIYAGHDTKLVQNSGECVCVLAELESPFLK